jgi:hypothetical protein
MRLKTESSVCAHPAGLAAALDPPPVCHPQTHNREAAAPCRTGLTIPAIHDPNRALIEGEAISLARYQREAM